MTGPSLARRRAALFALSMGGFGIGCTEFLAMGLLPQIARDLLPGVWAHSSAVANAQAGAVISAYALGVVVGAPTIAATLARLPRRGLLIGFIAAFALASLASAVAPSFAVLVVIRFLAGLPHGAYFGIASLVAGDLLGPGRRGLGVALTLAGLTIANVIGIPVLTAIGQAAGWRVSYLVIAAVFAAAGVAIAVTLPYQPGNPLATVRRELGVLRHGQVWLSLGAGAVGFGGFFAVDSYLAPLTTVTAGLPAQLVPFTLVLMGLGMTAGNLLGGRIADRGALRGVAWSLAAMVAVLAFVALCAGVPMLLFAGALLLGLSSNVFAVAVQTRTIEVAHDGRTLAAALNHSALNLGNGLGAALGGAAIAAGFGYAATGWVGVVLGVAGGLFVVIAIVTSRGPQTAAARATGVS